jgi:hypothetical protein
VIAAVLLSCAEPGPIRDPDDKGAADTACVDVPDDTGDYRVRLDFENLPDWEPDKGAYLYAYTAQDESYQRETEDADDVPMAGDVRCAAWRLPFVPLVMVASLPAPQWGDSWHAHGTLEDGAPPPCFDASWEFDHWGYNEGPDARVHE